MNSRIQELAQQATQDILGVPIVDQQKFAELIVRECITTLERHHPYTIDPEAYHYAISLIEEHFGVGE